MALKSSQKVSGASRGQGTPERSATSVGNGGGATSDGVVEEAAASPATRQDVGVDERSPERTGSLEEKGSSRVNIGEQERLISLVGGGLLALAGLARRSVSGLGLAALGGGLVYRGVTGHSSLYDQLGIDTAARGRSRSASVPTGRGIRVEKIVTINRSAAELYRFWRDFENLPRIMGHVEVVQVIDPMRSRWAVVGPGNLRFEWDSIVINDREGELIAWRSIEDSDVDHAGSVHFKPAPGGRGTEVKVVLRYDPPGGTAGAAIAKLLGRDPGREIEEDLRHFKQIMEAGEIPRAEAGASGAWA